MSSDPGSSASSPAEPPNGNGGTEPVVFGVPASRLVDVLRGAGMAESDVVALVGRGIAAATGPADVAPTPPFVFQTHVNQTATECVLIFTRTFDHPDFIDGVTVVQGEETPEEIGFNKRFHNIEADLDTIAVDLATASNCMAELRLELFGVVQELQAKITEIDTRLDSKANKETKEATKESKEGKEGKEDKEGKEKEGKDGKDGKDGKEGKEGKEGHEKTPDKEIHKDGSKDNVEIADPFSSGAHESGEGERGGEERTFIRLEDRPEVGRVALADPDGDR